MDESQSLVYGVDDLLQVLLLIVACFGILVFRNNETIAARRRRVFHSFGYRIGALAVADGWFLYVVVYSVLSVRLFGN